MSSDCLAKMADMKSVRTKMSRLGSELCAALPSMGGDASIETAAFCRHPRECVADGVCLMAEGRERAAWQEHRAHHCFELRTGRTEIESFDVWAGLRAAA